MSFFDMNCMLGPTNTNREPSFTSAAELLKEMDRLGIDEALVYSSLAFQAHPFDGNAHILEETRNRPRLHPCWVVMPPGTDEMPPPEELVRQMQAEGVSAVRMFPQRHRFPFLERSCRSLLQALAAAQIPLLLDHERVSWTEIALDWREIFEIAERHPDLQLILLREGGTTARVLFDVWSEFPNIKLDASYIQEAGIVANIVNRFGADKLLFGSAAPRFDAGGPLASVRGAAISEAARADLAGNNARRLLHLPEVKTQNIAAWPCGAKSSKGGGFRVFDIHGHTGPWQTKYYPEWPVEQMVKRMDFLGIEKFCVSDVLAIGPDYRRGNDRMGRALRQFPDRLLGYAVYNPNYEADMKNEMRRCFEELGCSGVKLHCSEHDMSTEDRSYHLAFQTAHERACPLLCHCHEGPSPEYLQKVLEEYPNMKFIFAHLGGVDKAQISRFVEVANECPNLYLDLCVSVMPRGVLAWMVNEVPVEQILYGSDHPINDFAFQLGRVLYADIDDATKQKILWDNAVRIFGVQPQHQTETSNSAPLEHNNIEINPERGVLAMTA